MAAGTALSRVTGLGRTVALAAALGVTAVADAYNTANTAPLMIYTLVAGGVLTSALVPLLVRSEGREGEQREVASVILGTAMAVAVAVTLVALAAAPLIMRALTYGARDRADYAAFLDLGTSWLRMFTPQIAAYALSVLAVGIMTARGRLALGAFAPVATNVVTIGAVLVFMAMTAGAVLSPSSVKGGAVAVLGWGTTAGVVVMALLQWLGARRSERGLRFSVRVRHPAVRELAGIGRWMLLYVLVNQLGLAAVIAMANTVAGGVTAYQWAFMLMQLPYAVIAVSLYTAALPALARAADGRGDLSAEAAPVARRATALLAPAAVGLWLLARPAAAALVGVDGAPLVAAAIAGFAASLVPFTLFQLFTRVSYAFTDTRTPALVNIAVNAVNVGIDVAVVMAVRSASGRVTGLALGHAASYVVGCVVLGRLLQRRRGLSIASVLGGSGRVAGAVAMMTAALIWVPALGRVPDDRWAAAVAVTLGAGAGIAVYGIAGRLLQVPGLPRVGR